MQNIFEWNILADTRCSKPRYVVFFIGQPDAHIMDWAGGNYHHIKAPGQPKFTSLNKAAMWARKEYERVRIDESSCTTGDGSFHGDCDGDAVFAARIVLEASNDNGKQTHNEISEEEWDDVRDNVAYAREEMSTW